MKNPFNIRVPSFDAQAVNETIRRALASAGLDTASGPMRDVTDTVRNALASAGLPTARTASTHDVVDVEARVVADRQNHDANPVHQAPVGAPPRGPAGSFETRTYTNRAGSRDYKLYVPTQVGATPPLVVMLHGCTQSADDFAVGTRMNQLADAHGFLVVYPEQSNSVNPSKCWNWFKAPDQVRDSGEPSLIAGIVRDVAARHGVDTRRIFVAGLSAGAAMAVILGETYPELFAGVGAHSGLPYRSAHDIPSAMAAMKAGRSGIAKPKPTQAKAARPRQTTAQAVPTIVFHGDRDHTVQHTNGAEIVQQATHAHAAAAVETPMRSSVERGTSAGGRNFSRCVHAAADGQVHVEFWTVHGAGHAWAGGSASGSYTDASGPDASAEMVRFFLSLPRAGSA